MCLTACTYEMMNPGGTLGEISPLVEYNEFKIKLIQFGQASNAH
jgi:hypothetical protein